MAEIINDQLSLLKKSALDVRQTTLAEVSDLSSYAYYSYAYDGLEVTVLNGGHPVKFTMNSNGASRMRKSHWTISSTIIADSYQDLLDFADGVVSALTISSSNISKAFDVGQKAVVLADETRNGGWSEYIVASVVNGVPVWEFNHADPQKFEIVANSADTAVELYYDGVKVGQSADLSGILSQWQYDQYIASGSVITEGDDKFLELYYNDGTAQPIRIDISSLGTAGEGAEGPQGPQGHQGAEGAQGPQGTEGAQGAEGAQGPQGLEGTQGPEGAQGPQGVEGTQGPQGVEGTQGPQGPSATFEVGEGLSMENDTLSVDEEYVKNIAVSAITESLIPEDAKEALDTLQEIAEYIQNHPDEVSAYTGYLTEIQNSLSAFSASVVNDYATSADTVAAIEEASRPSLSAATYTDAKALATANNVGQIIEVKNEEDISGNTYSDGLYIVAGAGEISKLGVTSATGDLSGDVESLKGRVGTLESNVSNIMDYLYWETDDELVIE